MSSDLVLYSYRIYLHISPDSVEFGARIEPTGGDGLVRYSSTNGASQSNAVFRRPRAVAGATSRDRRRALGRHRRRDLGRGALVIADARRHRDRGAMVLPSRHVLG